ncbi:MAG TPA: GAF domain-containing protein [Tepidisphaeraceae bacterium]|jgi:two-component sensor histidine kinase|nr:GAF domain-containing protein [Tepidisphaeraceae bacterium]
MSRQVKQNIAGGRCGPGNWWLPGRWWVSLAALFVFLVGVTLLTYALARSREALTLHSLAEADAINFTKRFQSEIDEQLRGIRRMKWNWIGGRYKNPGTLKAAAVEFQQKNPFCLEIGEADANGHVLWVWPEAGSRIPSDLTKHEEWEIALKAVKSNARDISAMWIDKKTNPQYLALVMPLGLGDGDRNEPMLVARVTPQPLVDKVIDGRIRDNHNVEIGDGTLTFYRIGPVQPKHQGYWEEQLTRFANRYWQVRLWPTGAHVGSRMVGLDRMILLGGVVVACLITLSFYQILRYRAWDLKQTERHLAALESLNEISTAISGKLGSGREIMQQLADAARRLLGLSRSIFTLLDAKDYCMRTYASSGDIPPGAPPVFPLDKMPVMRRCLMSGDVLFSEDMSKMSEPVNRDMVRAYDSASMIMIPLRVENRSIGMMALSDSRPRRFTDADRRLARLLGSQASVILANNRLYEQMREGMELQKQLHEQSGRDAQAKAILLRELHHRVKNNLAGIVGLLSMHEPDLTPAARQWLERVTERIQTMARAHDLFSGGIERVNLQQLVQQVLPSLSVLTPPGVTVRVNTGELDITFDTSRAVSLAMVLHELCTNALVHGLAGRGTLMISARRTGGSAQIEVSDEGGPASSDGGSNGWIEEAQAAGEAELLEEMPWSAAGTATAVQRGTGLYLVRELVRRELKGTLRLRRSATGGTIATIDLPLDGQENSTGSTA